MKKRYGLVSNSSSASFVIVWRHLDRSSDDNEKLLDETLERMFPGNPVADYIKKHTVRNEENNAFVSEFHTGMFNDMSDFKEASLLLAELVLCANDKYEILYKRIEDYGG